MQSTIRTLFKKGYNKSQIARMLEIDRKTVRKVPNEIELNGYVDIQANKVLTATRIYKDLKWEFDYKASYDSVRRYLKNFRSAKSAYMVLSSLPGEEVQVNFGYIGTLKVCSTTKKAWIFVMSLSYSRYMYAEIVFNQSIKTFIDCHKNVFKYFTGIPQIVKIDNLKAAILEADFYKPTVQKHYAAFANWYGFMIEPCRV